MSEVRYARRGEDHVAYVIHGDGPHDVVIVSNWLTDVESGLDAPFVGEWLERIPTYGRAIVFDQPGTGHSDPIFGEMPSVETFADTIEVVMDAAGLDRATLIAWDLATAPAVMFAATRPDRAGALITIDGSPRWLEDAGYPGIPESELDAIVELLVRRWGTHEYGSFLAPSMAGDPEACETVARWTRHALSPGMARRVFRLALSPDVRPLLPSVSCPALVVAARHAAAGAPLAHAEYLSEHLPDARLAVYDSADHLPYQPEHRDWLGDLIEEFVTGRRPEPALEDRVLATVVFTDVVASTETLASLGDERWGRRLEEIERLARETVGRYRGRLVKTTGDGVLATFDGPARAVHCATALRDAVHHRAGVELRAGVHTGEIALRGDDVGGLAVHIAARVMALAPAGGVLASSIVKDLVAGSGLVFADHGEHELRGVPGSWRLYEVRG